MSGVTRTIPREAQYGISDPELADVDTDGGHDPREVATLA